MPTRLCLDPRCPDKAEIRGRCRQHASEQRKQTRSVNDSFYGSKAWKMTRRAKLFADPLCQYVMPDGSLCGYIADSVHHVLPIEEGGARRDPANLLSVCRSHHSTIHAARRGGTVASYGL